MKTPSFLVAILAFLLSLSHAAAEPTRDHVLLITIDDLNDWISCLSDEKSGRGHPQASTPHLDALGELFTNAHCQAPMCRPSRTSFLSGLRPSTTGAYGNRGEYNVQGRLKPGTDVPWLPNRFKQAGYRTFPAGKVLHHGNHSLCDERYRYTRYADGSEELYDRVADPHEHHNLILQTGDRPELRAAIERLAAWLPKEQAGEPDLLLHEPAANP